jgi:hypothetical protein
VLEVFTAERDGIAVAPTLQMLLNPPPPLLPFSNGITTQRGACDGAVAVSAMISVAWWETADDGSGRDVLSSDVDNASPMLVVLMKVLGENCIGCLTVTRAQALDVLGREPSTAAVGGHPIVSNKASRDSFVVATDDAVVLVSRHGAPQCSDDVVREGEAVAAPPPRVAAVVVVMLRDSEVEAAADCGKCERVWEAVVLCVTCCKDAVSGSVQRDVVWDPKAYDDLTALVVKLLAAVDVASRVEGVAVLDLKTCEVLLQEKLSDELHVCVNDGEKLRDEVIEVREDRVAVEDSESVVAQRSVCNRRFS